MTNLKKEARGRECQIRMPGICCRDTDTVVLAHYRMPGLAGMAKKPFDQIGAWACRSCHDEADRRTTLLPVEQANLYHAEGVFRTQAILIAEGKIS